MTISSEVDICNLSADLLNTKPITSIAPPETSTEEAFSRWYDQTRRQALRRHPWNFATKRVVLAADSIAPAFGWSASFTLPTDFIRMGHINQSVIVSDNPVPSSLYTIEGGKVLIGNLSGTDTTQLRLVYVSDFTNVPQMDPAFINYFSILLAKNVSYKFTQSNSTIQRVDALMKEAEATARSIDGQDNPPKRVERSRNRQARRTSGAVSNLDGTIVFR